MENIQIDKNGTRYGFNQQGEMMAECQYCSVWFVPARRFNQKYCCNSCKSMASERRNGLSGPVSYSNRDKTTNSALKNKLEALEKKLDRLIEQQNKHSRLNQKELLQTLEVMHTDIRWAKYSSVIHAVIGVLKGIRDATIDEKVLSSLVDQQNQSKELRELLSELKQASDKDSDLGQIFAAMS